MLLGSATSHNPSRVTVYGHFQAQDRRRATWRRSPGKSSIAYRDPSYRELRGYPRRREHRSSTKTGEDTTITRGRRRGSRAPPRCKLEERLATRGREGHGLMFPHRFGEPEDVPHAGYRRAFAHGLTDPGRQEPGSNPQRLRTRPPRPPGRSSTADRRRTAVPGCYNNLSRRL